MNFDEVCKSIFGEESKYKGDPELHPMRESLFKFSHSMTPGEAEKTENGVEGELHK